MGRRPDPDQAKKGHPNRRRSANAKREAEQKRLAELLVANAGADIATPPKMIDQGPLYAAAVTVWKEMAPRLARTNRLGETHKSIFAMFCIYYADWVRLNDVLMKDGDTQVVATVAGGSMIRIHPAVRLRQQAFDNVMKLSVQFGLTPHDEYDLFRHQSLAAAVSPGLFGERPSTAQAQEPAPPVDGPQAGMLGAMNSRPPAGSC